MAHGFTIDLLVELVRAGLATATPQRMVAGASRTKSRGCGSPTRGKVLAAAKQ